MRKEHANIDQKNSMVAVLVIEKINFKHENTSGINGDFMITKELIH